LGKSCVIVLVGAETASRKWVLHEISRGWNDKKGVLGVRVNKLLGSDSRPSTAGVNPFYSVTFKGTTRTLGSVAPLKEPAGADSKAVYATIANNIESWIEEAIAIRAKN
jgi:antiphage defense system Thoeris ThsB-like protein